MQVKLEAEYKKKNIFELLFAEINFLFANFFRSAKFQSLVALKTSLALTWFFTIFYADIFCVQSGNLDLSFPTSIPED